MSNHYHIVVETPEGNLSKGMRHLNGVYTQGVNRSHSRVGHVFQGRYKAIIVDKNRYLLDLARYVVLNPVRAGMVRDIAKWPWSSYHAMIGTEPHPDWLQTDWILKQFSAQRSRAIQLYIDFLHEGVGLPSLWEHLRGQLFLGGDAFLKRMQQYAEKAAIGEIPRAQRRHRQNRSTTMRKNIANPKRRWLWSMPVILHPTANCQPLWCASRNRQPGDQGERH